MEAHSEVIFKIGVLVYNHSKYLRQSLNSLLDQQTNFKYEIWIFEDFSKDNSREIAKEYALRFPDKIKLALNDKNLGDFWNLRLNFKHLDAKYFALLDGDDYWCNENKIQEMITFLESHHQYVATSHNVQLIYEDKDPELLHKSPFERTSHDLNDIISGYCYHHTSALIYRNIFSGKLPEIYHHPSSGDWFMSMIFTEHGNIKYFPYAWSVYRIHQGGLWSRLTESQRTLLNMDSMIQYNLLFKGKYELLFDKNLYHNAWRYLKNCPKNVANVPYMIIFMILIFSFNMKENKLRILHRFFRKLYHLISPIVKVKIR